MAQALLEYETLSGDEIAIVVKGGKLNREEFPSDENNKNVKSGSVPTAGGVDLGSSE